MDVVQIEDGEVDDFASVDSGEIHCKDLACCPRDHKRKKGTHSGSKSDSICYVCQDGGFLILCDRCSSSYHLDCIDLAVHFPFLLFLALLILYDTYENMQF